LQVESEKTKGSNVDCSNKSGGVMEKQRERIAELFNQAFGLLRTLDSTIKEYTAKEDTANRANKDTAPFDVAGGIKKLWAYAESMHYSRDRWTDHVRRIGKGKRSTEFSENEFGELSDAVAKDIDGVRNEQ